MSDPITTAEETLERYDNLTNANGYGAGDHRRLAAALRSLIEHAKWLEEANVKVALTASNNYQRAVKAESERDALQARIDEALEALGGPQRMSDGHMSYFVTDDAEVRRILKGENK